MVEEGDGEVARKVWAGGGTKKQMCYPRAAFRRRILHLHMEGADAKLLQTEQEERARGCGKFDLQDEAPAEARLEGLHGADTPQGSPAHDGYTRAQRLCLCHAVGGQEDRTARQPRAEEVPQPPLADRVDPRARFVEEEDAGIADQGESRAEFPPSAPRVGPDALVCPFGDAELQQELVGAVLRCCPLHPRELATEQQMLSSRHPLP
eukprot:767790-Hanusia_phi.AAC.2